MKLPKGMIIFLVTAFSGLMLSLLLQLSGRVCVSYQGFGVDDVENIYLGQDSMIKVLSPEGEVLRTISPKTSRGYQFTILNNEVIVRTGTVFYRMDLEGTVLEEQEITDSNRLDLPIIHKKECVTSNGTVYLMKNRFFRTGIYRLEEQEEIKIYEMPLFDYVIKLIRIICFVSLWIVVPVYMFKTTGRIFVRFTKY